MLAAESVAHCSPELIVHRTLRLDSYAQADDVFHEPRTFSEVDAVYVTLEAVAANGGGVLPCRGRDFVPPPRGSAFGATPEVTPWDYGCCTVAATGKAYFIWSDKVESFAIRNLELRRLVHFVLPRAENLQRSISTGAEQSGNIVLISHGYSPQRGPDYAVIRTLEHVSWQRGWKPIVLCFLETYSYGPLRGRSERVRMILEELLCEVQPRKPTRVALVGHSQGGAASSVACTDRVAQAANIAGLMLIGSESPRSVRDGQKWKPSVLTRIVHAVDDEVVAFAELERLAQFWGTPIIAARGGVRGTDAYEDDVSHDFLSQELLQIAVDSYSQFLRDCARPVGESFSFAESPGTTVAFEEGVPVVSSAKGIGSCRLHLAKGETALRLRLKGLEKLELYSGTCRVRMQVASHGERSVLQERVGLDNTTEPCNLCSVQTVADGFVVSLTGDAIPKTEIAIEFFDFYRYRRQILTRGAACLIVGLIVARVVGSGCGESGGKKSGTSHGATFGNRL
jgi:pimeloyl-ACP methyl ester carboxylesterase